MHRAKNVFWMIGLYWLAALGIYGQAQRPTDIRTGGDSTSALKSVEPDIPGTTLTISTGSQAIVPRLMKFSGALRDAAGKPLTGTVDVTFSLYNTEAGGEPLWFETQSVQTDDLGRYTALLGAMHTDGLPVDLFTSGDARWLGIQVGAEAEQQPRVLLVSVPYALKAGDAETLGGKPASAYVLADAQSGTATGTVTTSTSGATTAGTKGATDKSGKTNVSPLVAICSTITSNVGGTANFLPMFTAQCNIENSVITQSGGNVGIGTMAPGAQLDVQNPTAQNNIAIRASNSNGTMMFIPNLSAGAYNGLVQTGDQGLIFYGKVPGAGNFVLGPWGSGGMRMTSAGNVGIGTAAPAATLEVNGTAQFDKAVTFVTAQSLSGPQLDVQTPVNQNTIALRATNAKGTMMMIPNLGAGAYNGLVQAGDQGLIFYGTAPNAGNFVIGPWTGGGSPGIRMTAAGNVGIGTASPAAKLEVNGTAQFDGAVTFAAGQTVTGSVSASTALVVDNAGTNNGSVNPGLTFGTASEEGIASKRTAGGNQEGLDFYTGNTNRMAITRAGLVGIGTTAPSVALDVVGDIRALLGMNVDGLGVNNGALTDGLTFGLSSGEGMASKRTAGGNQYGLDFYTEFADRMSIRQTGQVGIGTSNPYTTLHLRGDVAGGLGPTLLLMNGGAGGNAGASIDFDGYDPGGGNPPSARIQSYDDGNFSSHLSFQTKVPGGATNSLVEQARITSTGSLVVDSSGQNTGSLLGSTAGGTGLIFGEPGSGEGIASCRTGTNCPISGYSFTGPNLDGLDFFTDFHAGMSIANNGDIYVHGCTWWGNNDNQGNCPSDARLKYNIQPLSPVLDKLARLRPVHFNYRTAEYPQYHFPSLRMTGLIAQEVEKVFPDMVSTDEQGFKRLDSGPLKFMLLESVRELKERNDSLREQAGKQQAQLRQARQQNRAEEAEIQKLTAQVRKLTQDQTEIAALKARLDRLEAGESSTLRAQASQARKSKQSAHSEVARARF